MIQPTAGIAKVLASPVVDRIINALRQAGVNIEKLFRDKQTLKKLEAIAKRAKSGLKGSFMDDLISVGGAILGGVFGGPTGAILGAGLGKGVSKAKSTKGIGGPLDEFVKEHKGSPIGDKASKLLSDLKSARKKGIFQESLMASFFQGLMPISAGAPGGDITDIVKKISEGATTGDIAPIVEGITGTPYSTSLQKLAPSLGPENFQGLDKQLFTPSEIPKSLESEYYDVAKGGGPLTAFQKYGVPTRKKPISTESFSELPMGVAAPKLQMGALPADYKSLSFADEAKRRMKDFRFKDIGVDYGNLEDYLGGLLNRNINIPESRFTTGQYGPLSQYLIQRIMRGG